MNRRRVEILETLADDLWDRLCHHINEWCAVQREPEELFFVELRDVVREEVGKAFNAKLLLFSSPPNPCARRNVK